jgi:hypothetical protein
MTDQHIVATAEAIAKVTDQQGDMRSCAAALQVLATMRLVAELARLADTQEEANK